MRILLAVDGSPASDAAAEEVARRPWPAGSSLKVVSAFSLPIPTGPDPFVSYVGFREELTEAARGRARAVVEGAADIVRRGEEGGKLQITTEVVEGTPRRAVVEAAEGWGADLVVVGSHGYGGLQRFLLGSVSSAVLTHAPCSVEVVRPRPQGG